MTQPTAEQLEVTQADRDAAAGLCHEATCFDCEYELLQAFARHRLQTEARMAAAVEALTKAAERFREYETSHMRKGSIDGDMKARRNCEMAEMCEAAIRRI